MDIWIYTVLQEEDLEGVIRIAGPLEVVISGLDDAEVRHAFHLEFATEKVDPENLRGTFWVKRGEETILYLGGMCFNEDPYRVLDPETGFRCNLFFSALCLCCENDLKPTTMELGVNELSKEEVCWLFSLLRATTLQ